ncbi:MAG: Gfo/Idh/MocA family oxidoreductase [Vicinamibacterales bacterium]
MRIALVGLGNAGFDIHLPALAGIQSASIVALCDLDEGRRNRASAMYGAPSFAHLDDMLIKGRPDVVVIGTPPDSHADACVRSLEAGAHVLCEKPFVSSLEEADTVLNAAARAGRRVALNHEFREMPIFRALRDQLTLPASPSLRFVQMWQLMDLPPHAEVEWRGRMVQRTLFEAGVHLVDLAMNLFGETPLSVQASTYGGQGPASDAVAVVTLEFSGGRLAHLTQNRLCKGETHYFEVRADTADASYRASFGGRARMSAGLYGSTRPHMRFEFGRSGIAWKEVGSRRSFMARNPNEPTVRATRAVFQKTFDAFHTGADVPTSGQLAREILKVIVACYHSASSGQRLRLDDPVMQGLLTTRLGA